MYRTWAGKLQWGLLQGQTVQSAVRSPGTKSSSQYHQRRRIDGPDPKQTSCPIKTEEYKMKSSVYVLNTE